MKTLHEIFAGAGAKGSDKGSIHSYLEPYSELFDPYRDEAINILEVGVRDGSSLRAWAEYFPHATIHGIDNGSEAGLPLFTESEKERINLVVADTTKPAEFLRALITRCSCAIDCVFESCIDEVLDPFLDIVIDDGNHDPLAQAATFALLSPFVVPGGLYVCEDVVDPLYGDKMVALFGGEFLDLRAKKERHDDAMWIWRKPK